MLKLADRNTVEAGPFPDPLAPDLATDERIVVTKRRLVRLALVACETGARFERDGVRHDPMAWMLGPRRLFEGGTAMEACLGLDGCSRAILLHGLALGLDADAEDIDELMDEDAVEGRTGKDFRIGPAAPITSFDVGFHAAAAARGAVPFFRPDARLFEKVLAA